VAVQQSVATRLLGPDPAGERNVATSTQARAKSALLFLYREVLDRPRGQQLRLKEPAPKGRQNDRRETDHDGKASRPALPIAPDFVAEDLKSLLDHRIETGSHL
jgi:hypothetical protein